MTIAHGGLCVYIYHIILCIFNFGPKTPAETNNDLNNLLTIFFKNYSMNQVGKKTVLISIPSIKNRT